MSTLDALKEEALAALIEGNGEEALRCLGALEALDPASGSWPHKRGQLLLRLGRKDEAVEALGRAAERYGRCGLAAKAIAVSKTILAADPGHTRTQDRLSELLATSEGPDRGAATAWSIPRGNPGPAGAPLLERTLADLVPGSRTASEFPSDEMPAVALAIDVEIEEPDPTSGFDDDPPSAVHSLPVAARTALQTLPKTPLFSSLGRKQLRLLIEAAELRRFPAGELVFRQGDPGHELYIIVSGKVAVMAPDEIARLGEGSFFGEIALLTNRGRTASVRACTNTELLAIPRPLFARLLEESPEVLKVLLRFVRGRLVSRLVETSPLFAPFSGPERNALSGKFRFLELGPRTTVLEQARHAPGFFVMLAGEARVLRDRQVIATLGSGDVFGEVSLLTGEPATASVQTTTKSFVLELPSDEFRTLVLRHPAVLEYLRSLSDDGLRLIGRLPVT